MGTDPDQHQLLHGDTVVFIGELLSSKGLRILTIGRKLLDTSLRSTEPGNINAKGDRLSMFLCLRL